jgi:hypothetical protein
LGSKIQERFTNLGGFVGGLEEGERASSRRRFLPRHAG